MTDLLFRDAYLQSAEVTVTKVDQNGVTTDGTIFYAQGGGQPGDSGYIKWAGGQVEVINSRKTDGEIAMVLAEGSTPPEVGQKIHQTLNWDRRLAHMKIHTALHLLSVVIPLPVSGGAITDQKGRLDFDMPQGPENKEALAEELNEIIACDLPISETWITDAELEANPGLVKSMTVKPPTGAGHVRLIRIGEGVDQIDLQPCGGTHVRSTGEIGRVRIGKIEKKGRQNRRVNLFLESS